MNPNKRVTDPKLLEALEGRRVKDPNLLSQLNSGADAEGAAAYLDNLPKPEGFFSKLPRNIVAGIGNLQRNLFNTPHDLLQNFEQQGEIFRQGLPKPNISPQIQEQLYGKSSPKFSENLPYQPEFNYPEFFGQKGEGTLLDNLIQKGVEHAPEIAGLGALVRGGFRRLPITKTGASRKLQKAEKLVNELGVPNIPIHSSTLYEAEKYLPKTYSSREMLGQASAGEYNPSFALQSQLGKHQRDLAKSPLAAERLISPEVHDLRQSIIQQMDTGLRAQGHDEIADLLRGGLKDYRTYIKFREAVKPILKTLKIPTTVLGILGLGTQKGRKIISNLFD